MTAHTVRQQSIPVLPKPTIERPRLLKTLQAILHHKLAIITAPPGFGKTTVVSQFARQIDVPVIWQTVEEPDRDLPNLYSHTLAAFGEIAPGMTDNPFHAGHAAGELVIGITDYLRDHLSSDVIYILDDVHHLVESSTGDAWLRRLIHTLPRKCHLVLLSRLLPNLPLTEMIARREVLAMGQSQLRFTTDETYEMAHTIDVELAPLDAERLTTRLDGWPAGVLLALQPMPSEFEQSLFAGQASPEALFNDLAQNILNAQSPTLQRFLLVSSTLSRVTPDLCKQILHLTDAAAHLSAALQHNLFMHQVPGGVVYHSLFREFLQRRLRTLSPIDYIELHAQAGQWFENNNQLDEGFMHYAAGGCWDNAAAIAQQVAQAYFAQGKIETILKWNAQLEAVKVSAPDLRYACAMIHVDRYQYDQATTELTKAAEDFQEIDDTTGLLKVELLFGTIDNQTGQYERAARRAKMLLNNPILPVNLRAYALLVLGVATLQLGDAPTALGFFERSLPIHRSLGDVYATSQLLGYMVLAYFRLGRFDDAGEYLQEIVVARRSFGSVIGLVFALNDLGYYHHQMGNYERALESFQEGLSILSRFPQERAESVLLWSLGDIQRDRHAFDEAARYYLRSLELVGDSDPALRCAVVNSFAMLRRWQGKLDISTSLAEESFNLAERHHISIEHAKAEINIRVIRAVKASPGEAEEELENIARRLLQQQSFARLAQTWCLSAYLALLADNEPKAVDYFKLMEKSIPHPANLQLVAAEILHAPVLTKFVRKHNTNFQFLRESLKNLERAQVQEIQGSEAELEVLPPALSLRVWTLGQETVERDGVPIPTADWRFIARELFFYLLQKGPTPRETVCVDFWPDSTSQQVRRNFHTTIYRVRQALGENTIVFQNERYFINPDLDAWCDAHEFETLIQEARLLSPRTAHAERLWQRAVSLYQGDFLPTVDMEWAHSQRELLRDVYLEGLVGLGNCARARGERYEAVALYKRATEVDAYREDVHRMILSTYSEQGERSQILKHYNELIAFLQDELGVEPSHETRSLAQALLA